MEERVKNWCILKECHVGGTYSDVTHVHSRTHTYVELLQKYCIDIELRQVEKVQPFVENLELTPSRLTEIINV
jgi:hypothetical protein